MINETIASALQESLKQLGIFAEEIKLDHPTDLSHGDISTNVALALAKREGKNPKELALEIVRLTELNKPNEVDHIEIAGPGFINFYLTPEFFRNSTQAILTAKEKWGGNHFLSDKKVMVEYTQPNPFKEFHIGHLMSNAVGESISRLIEFSGAEVRRVNYQGDIGLHVAKALWAINKEGFDTRNLSNLGNAYAYGHAQYESDEIAKAEIVELNKQIASGSFDLKETYDIGLKTSLEHFEELYRILGTKFDFYFFESQSLPAGRLLVEKGLASGVFENSEGAVVFRGEEYGLHTRVFVTQFGTTTYETRDLGLPLLKKEKFAFDTSITITAVEQAQYFDVVFKAFALLNPDFKGALQHVSHGMMQLTSGKMSSREGNVVTGESLLHDTQELVEKKMKDSTLPDINGVAEAVSVAGIKYSILKQATGRNISFDLKQSVSFEGDSGPYLQYTNARINSILEKAESEGVSVSAEGGSTAPTDVEKLLYRFPEVVERAGREYEPHYVANYLIELAGAFNSWYGQEKILDGTVNASYKLALAKAVSITLQNGLWVLGIKSPERM